MDKKRFERKGREGFRKGREEVVLGVTLRHSFAPFGLSSHDASLITRAGINPAHFAK